MFETNPFMVLSDVIPVTAMQIYVVLMVVLVIGGTVLDMVHKRSAEYFFENAKKAETEAKRRISGGEKMSLAVGTLANEVLTSAEFKNPRRRMSHLLTMYGFIFFVVSTAVLIFGYTGVGAETSALWTGLWHLGALMVAGGGYWFWFAIRVDVSAEGNPWYRLVRADLFIASLLATVTFALIWSVTQGGKATGGSLFWFVLFIGSSTTLFGSVLWSKFAHMFFKPAAAYQKKIAHADGSRENLPEIPELSSSETKRRYPDIPTYMGENPPYMGLGIKREPPRHY